MHQTSDTEEAMVTESKEKKKKKKYWHCLQISKLHCPRAQKDTTLTGCASGNFVTTFARDHGVRI